MEGNKVQNYKSCFDIIGPIMVGPFFFTYCWSDCDWCSCETVIRWNTKKRAMRYYESFAETHKGHGTDFAIISGILGFATDDERVPRAVEIAKSEGMHIEFCRTKRTKPCESRQYRGFNLMRREAYDSPYRDLCWWRSGGSEGHRSRWL